MIKNNDTRYRSHHDSERALRSVLNLPRRRVDPEAPDLSILLDSDSLVSRRGLYLHVPYCDRICAFCNMKRSHGTAGIQADYVRELAKQLEEVRGSQFAQSKPFEVVYFGGGTPTVLSTPLFERLLSCLRESIPLSDEYEWTVETTVHNSTDEKIDLMRAAGVNRLSIGVQTFSDRGRKLLGRTGSGAYVKERIEAIRERFRGTIGIDIIYSYPGQTIDEIDEDTEAIRALDVDSVSFYSLMLHEGSRLHGEIASGTLAFPRTVETDRTLHHRFCENMYRHGFELLELTKLVRPGRDTYRYIRLRYDGGDLLPIGSGAGGSIVGHNIYRMSSDRILISPVDPTYERYHRVLGHLQFGQYDSPILASLCGFGSEERIVSLLESYEYDGYLERKTAVSWELTNEGIFYGNNLAVDFLGQVVRQDYTLEIPRPATHA